VYSFKASNLLSEKTRAANRHLATKAKSIVKENDFIALTRLTRLNGRGRIDQFSAVPTALEII